MKSYNYILFDFDGCVAKTLDIWLAAYKKVFAEYNVFPTDHQITYEVFGDWKGCQKFGIEDDKTFGEKLIVEVEREYPHVELYPQVRETLTRMRQIGKKLALITSSESRIVKEALDNNHITEFFDSFVFGDEVANHKPHPESLDKALEVLDGKRAEAIMIGDSKSDLGAAENAEMDSVLFHPDHNKLFYELDVLNTYHPTFTIKDFRELSKIINL